MKLGGGIGGEAVNGEAVLGGTTVVLSKVLVHIVKDYYNGTN